MPLKSMKVSKKDKKKIEREIMVADEPKYPWGLRIHLDEDSISKLDMDKLPSAGDKKMLIAIVEVSEVGEHDSMNGKKRRNLQLQITDMSLEKVASNDTLETLYGKE